LRSRVNAEKGATWRVTSHDYGSRRAWWGGARGPRGSMDPTSVSGMTPRPRRSTRWWQAKVATTGSRWSGPAVGPTWSDGIDASPSRAGLNWRWSRCGFPPLPQVRTIPLVVENATCR